MIFFFKRVLIFTFPKLKKTQYLHLTKLATTESANMCSKKDVPLLLFSYLLGEKWGAKAGAKWGAKAGEKWGSKAGAKWGAKWGLRCARAKMGRSSCLCCAGHYTTVPSLRIA
jgi:hypothetical protein